VSGGDEVELVPGGEPGDLAQELQGDGVHLGEHRHHPDKATVSSSCGSETINFGSGSGSYQEGHFRSGSRSGSCPWVFLDPDPDPCL